MEKQQTDKKVMVVWIDGGTFDVIQPMLKNRKLPAFRKIMNEGVSSVLLSTIPPITTTAWSSFATGVNPGKHGVYGFWEVKNNSITLVNSHSIRRQTFWSMLNKANKKVILLNAPLTYPVTKVKGLLITGLMTPGSVPYTYPKGFRKKLLREFPEYRIYTQTRGGARGRLPSRGVVDEYTYLEEAFSLLKTRRDTALYLMENYDWDLFFVDFFYTDQIQHNFWKYLDSTHPAHNPNAPKMLKEAIQKAYEIVNDSLNKILKTIGEDVTLIVMSDHGFGPTYKIVYINSYLRKIGIVKMDVEGAIRFAVNSLLRDFLKVSMIDVDRLPRVLEYIMGARRIIFDILYGKRQAVNESSHSTYLSKFIDWNQTRAYSTGFSGHIYVNRKLVKSNRGYVRLINYLTQKLYGLTDPETGKKIVDKVFKGSEIYRGPHVDSAPDLTLIMRKMTYIASRFIANQIVEPATESAYHRMEGILIMHGKDVRRGYFLKECDIVDLAPTILYLMGIQVPSDMDGVVLTNAFHSSYVETHPVRIEKKASIRRSRERYALSKEEEQKIKQRLKALGYLG